DVVDLVAADRVAGLGQVDADLVRPARLQPARDDRVARQPLGHVHVRDRLLAEPRGPGAAASPVAAIAYKEAPKSARLRHAGHHGCFASPVIKTPNLDKLAAEGLKLTHCYAPSPVCSPSRAGMMTG